MANENRVPVVRAPLSTPAGDMPLPHLSNSLTLLVPYENSFTDGAAAEGLGTRRASPRWAAVQGEGCIVVVQDPQPTIAAQVDGAKVRVENCERGDADDVSRAQPEQSSRY